MNEFRIGLVGCGLLAERGYIPALRRTRGVKLAAVADSVASRCERVAGNLPRFASAADLVASRTVDGLVLATPAAAHLADARIAAQAGLATLVEKPPASDAAEAAALAALDPMPAIGFNLRFDPDLRRLRDCVPERRRVDLRFDLHHAPGSWPSYVVGDDALLRLGPHLVDLARWLTGGEIQRVRSMYLTSTRAEFELESNRGRARISCATDRPPATSIALRDEDGRLIRLHTPPAAPRRIVRRLIGGTALVRCLVPQLEAFAEYARGRPQTLLATAVDGLAVMSAIDAARRSAGNDRNWCPIVTTTNGGVS